MALYAQGQLIFYGHLNLTESSLPYTSCPVSLESRGNKSFSALSAERLKSPSHFTTNSTSKETATLKRKTESNHLYETAMKRSSQKIEREQTDDKFCYLGRTWGEDMREINEHNPTTFLLARRLIEEIITKAHFGELTLATRIVNVEPLSFHES